MRKIRWVLLFSLIIILCGCGAKKQTRPVTTGISFVADITCRNGNYLCDCTVDRAGDMTVCVRQPQALDGLKITFTCGKASAEFLGLKYTPQNDRFPAGAMAQYLYGILQSGGTATVKKANGTLSGKVDGRPYTLKISPAGFPLEAEIPDDNCRISFRQVTVLSH